MPDLDEFVLNENSKLRAELAAVTKERDSAVKQIDEEQEIAVRLQRRLDAETARADKLQAALDGMDVPITYVVQNKLGFADLRWNAQVRCVYGDTITKKPDVPLYSKPEVK